MKINSKLIAIFIILSFIFASCENDKTSTDITGENNTENFQVTEQEEKLYGFLVKDDYYRPEEKWIEDSKREVEEYLEEQKRLLEEQKEKIRIIMSSDSVNPGDYITLFVPGVFAEDELIYSGFNKDNVKFFDNNEGRLALISADYRTKPGIYDIGIQIIRNGELFKEMNVNLTVMSKKFPAQYLQVTQELASTRSSTNFVNDGVYTSEARSSPFPQPLWEGAFLKPVEGRISSEFGLIRYINGVDSGRHSGIDIVAETGTPIMAANNGRVVLAMTLIITGETVIIDHGMNVFSAYAHLSKLNVAKGDTVKKGDIIGEVGSTGFSTGAHLHWTISVGYTFTNPWLFLEEDPLKKMNIK